MAISYIYTGEPMTGTSDDDFMMAGPGTGTSDNTVDAGDGDDWVLADASEIHLPSQITSNGSIATAFDLDWNLAFWTTDENPLFGDASIPHATAVVETTVGESEVFGVYIGAGETITIDVDYGYNSPIGISEDLVVELLDENGDLLWYNDDSSITDGGLGSEDNYDSYLTYTADTAGYYYINAHPYSDATFIDNSTFVLNVSVTGHAVGAATAMGDDTIDGGAGADALFGQGGADIIDGGEGNDTIDGGSGDDTLYGGADYNIIYGGLGIDTIYGGDYLDDIYGGQGNDTLYGGGEYDIIYGEDGNDTVYGGDDYDEIYGDAGNDKLDGGAGDDYMEGGAGNDWFYAGSAGDVVVEYAGEGTADRVLASLSYTLEAGVDIEILSTTNNSGTGAINLTGNELANSIYGNAGANTLNGGDGIDTLSGLAGNDKLDGGLGVDSMSGGTGNDWFFVDDAGDVITEVAGGGTGDRVLSSVNYTLADGVQVEILSTTSNGGTGAINLSGNELANSIYGNAGANILNGRGGADVMTGLGGSDRFYVDNAGDVVNESAGGGTADRVLASVSYTLTAGSQVEVLTTHNSASTSAINLTGNEFANSIFGNAGANVLNGGGGADVLDGLGGADMFRFNTALGAGNIDAISNYSIADDGIQLENAVFTGLAAGGLASGAFFIGSAAHDSSDRVIYNSSSGALLFDADGTGAGAAVQFATLSSGLAMTSAEFLVI